MEPKHATLSREEAEGLTVAEVMLQRPKTLPVDATVADLRRVFEHSSVRTVLLVDGRAFVGTVERPNLPADAADSGPARAYARTDAATVGPDVPVRDVLPYLDGSSEGRLVVVDEDGSTLRGLLCLRSAHDIFCIDG